MKIKTFAIFTDDGCFARYYDAQESPNEPGVFIRPKLSTPDLPKLEEDKWPFFKNGAWVQVPDYRGQIFYDTERNPVLIDDFGDVPISLFKSPPPLSVDEKKAKKIDEIKHEVSVEIEAGVKCNALGVDYFYPTTTLDQLSILGLIVLANNSANNAEFKLWCADEFGVWARRNHTKNQLFLVHKSIIDNAEKNKDIYAEKLTKVKAAKEEELPLI